MLHYFSKAMVYEVQKCIIIYLKLQLSNLKSVEYFQMVVLGNVRIVKTFTIYATIKQT